MKHIMNPIKLRFLKSWYLFETYLGYKLKNSFSIIFKSQFLFLPFNFKLFWNRVFSLIFLIQFLIQVNLGFNLSTDFICLALVYRKILGFLLKFIVLVNNIILKIFLFFLIQWKIWSLTWQINHFVLWNRFNI